MSIKREIFVKKELSNFSSELGNFDLSARVEFDWTYLRRGLELELIDKENALEEYCDEIQEELDLISKRKELLCVWAGKGASEEKKAALRREYVALLCREAELNAPAKRLATEIDSEFGQFGEESVEFLPQRTKDYQLFDFFKLYVDKMSLEELDNAINYFEVEFQAGGIYYNTFIALSLVCFARAKELVTPQSYSRQGFTYLKAYNAGYKEEYQKFLKLYQKLQQPKKEREAARRLYESASKGYLTEDQLIERIDGLDDDFDFYGPTSDYVDSRFFEVEVPVCNEHTLVLDALVSTNGNKSAAGRLLGVSKTTVRRRLEKAVAAAR